MRKFITIIFVFTINLFSCFAQDGKITYYALLCGSGSTSTLPYSKLTENDLVTLDVLLIRSHLIQYSGSLWKPENISMLTNTGLTKTTFDNEIKRIAGLMDNDDVFFLFYSGHGGRYTNVPISYLKLSNSTVLEEADLYSYLSGTLPAGSKKVVYLNACHSGGFCDYFNSNNLKNTLALSTSLATQDTQMFTWLFLFPNVFSNGAYQFHNCIEGLADSNNDQTTTFKEIATYIKRQIPIGSANLSTPVAFPFDYATNQLANLAFCLRPTNTSTIPALTIVKPAADLTLQKGENFSLEWTDDDMDNNALISFATDKDLVDEPWVVGTNSWIEGALMISEDNETDKLTISTANMDPGTYTIWGYITDNEHEPVYSRALGKITINAKPSITSGSVTPISGTTTDTYQFSVKYIDQNPSPLPPSGVRVIIDGSTFNMTKKNTADNDYYTGVEYVYSMTGSTTGTHYYSFSASDNSGNVLPSYPSTGTQNFYVRQSVTGWDAAIDPTNTTYSPASIKASTVVTVNLGVKNNGLYTYTSLPVRIMVLDPAGTLIKLIDLVISNVDPGITKTTSTTFTMPSSVINGTYSISTCVQPVLDSNSSNDCCNTYFYIGENLGNEQFRNTAGQVTVATGGTFSINGKTFTLAGINTSTSYATVRDPGNNTDKVYVNQIKIFGTYNSLIRNDAVYSSSGVGYAALTGFYAYNTGAAFDNVEINASPGTTVYAYANAPSSYLFSSSNYELYSTSSTAIKSWLGSVSRVTTWARIKIKFNIPADAPIGKTTLYLLTEYSTPSGYADMTRLTFYITNPVPTITTLSKTNISADDQITITGTNLSTTGTVKFNDVSVTATSWSPTSIVCTVPQNVASGVVTVVNTNGTSNQLPYIVLSSTGTPIVQATIPDQLLVQGNTLTICDLDNIITDPNGTLMTFSVNTNNSKITVDLTTFSSDHILKLTGATDLMSGSRIDIVGTDASSKTASTSFNVTVPAVLRLDPSIITVPATGGSGTINIISNVAWTNSTLPSWINKSVSGNLVTLTISPNTSSTPRSSVVIISGGGIQSNLMINQDGALASPTLLAPVNGALRVAIFPVLSWGISSGAMSYRIQVSTNSSFSSTVFDNSGITGTSIIINGLIKNTLYYWRVCASKTGEISSWSQTYSFTTDSEVGMELLNIEGIKLEQNYPNPFTGTTHMIFEVPHEAKVEISIISLSGNKVANLLDQSIEGGRYDLFWNPEGNIKSGTYYARMKVNGLVKSMIQIIYLK